jgi:pimeloyl-ACP methyl ester carboxylesterase
MTDRRPTIVFLHGSRLTSVAWTAQIAALESEFHCLAPDLVGHGQAAAETFTVDGAADRIAELIADDAHGGRAVVVGLSLGGYVAMALAARHPERVRGLVLTGATAEPVGPRAIFFLAYWAVFRYAPPRLDRAATAWYFRRRFPPPLAEPIVAAGVSFPDRAAALRSLVGQRFKPRLAAYPGPSLIINGEYDLFFRPSERSFADVAADPRRVVIRRASHLVNLEQPEAFTAVVRRFARSLPPVRATPAAT